MCGNCSAYRLQQLELEVYGALRRRQQDGKDLQTVCGIMRRRNVSGWSTLAFYRLVNNAVPVRCDCRVL